MVAANHHKPNDDEAARKAVSALASMGMVLEAAEMMKCADNFGKCKCEICLVNVDRFLMMSAVSMAGAESLRGDHEIWNILATEFKKITDQVKVITERRKAEGKRDGKRK